MKTGSIKQLSFQELEQNSSGIQSKNVILNKDRFVEVLSELLNTNNQDLIKKKISALRDIVVGYKEDKEGIINIDIDGDTISVRMDVLVSQLEQILRSHTIDRAKYYIERLKKGYSSTKTNKINDLNLLRWKEYDYILTDSLWIFDKRDTSGAHLGWYWGNFIPQIPRQLMLRYTKMGDWVLDTFSGSGTTLIECRRLGRNGIGIELNQNVAIKARESVEKEQNRYNVITDIVVGDSRTIDIGALLSRYNIKRFQFIIMHPPYHDIIKFSRDSRDLSNAKTVQDFLENFGLVVDNTYPYLEKGRYFALVIGDKYSGGQWLPLGFYCMNEVLKRGYLLKSIIVKNFNETRGKRNQQELWRYRALVGGFYVFKHEYIFLFIKKG